MIFQVVIASKSQDSGSMKRLSVKGMPSEVIELLSNSGIAVVLKQLINERKQLGRVSPSVTHRHGNCLGRSPFEAHLSRNDLLILKQGDIREQQTDHAFA